jgi:hypothetical protein
VIPIISTVIFSAIYKVCDEEESAMAKNYKPIINYPLIASTGFILDACHAGMKPEITPIMNDNIKPVIIFLNVM